MTNERRSKPTNSPWRAITAPTLLELREQLAENASPWRTLLSLASYTGKAMTAKVVEVGERNIGSQYPSVRDSTAEMVIAQRYLSDEQRALLAEGVTVLFPEGPDNPNSYASRVTLDGDGSWTVSEGSLEPADGSFMPNEQPFYHIHSLETPGRERGEGFYSTSPDGGKQQHEVHLPDERKAANLAATVHYAVQEAGFPQPSER